MAKEKKVHIRMDNPFYKKVKQYAADRGLTVSEALRGSIRDSLTMAGYYDRPQVDRTPGHGIIDG